MENSIQDRSKDSLNVAFIIEPNERGTAVAVYDYAHFNESLLANRSIILMPANVVDLPASERFRQRFKVFAFDSDAQLTGLLIKEKVDVCYQLTHGRKNVGHPAYEVPANCRQAIHCVFSTKDPVGDVHASISHYLNRKCNTACPVVPHMIHLPEVDGNLRSKLGIPEDATVFGRYGGRDTFSVKLAHEVITEMVRERPDYYFIFMNTDSFCEPHPQIIHLPASFDLEEKVRFINTCDAMLHARRDGETFGIAVGEFSIKNKPIFTFAPPERGMKRLRYLIAQSFKSMTKTGQRLPRKTSTEHISILGEKAFIYSSKRELKTLLSGFDRVAARQNNWDCYSFLFSPDPVMRQFNKVFLNSKS